MIKATAAYKSVLVPKNLVLPSSRPHLITCALPDDKIKRVVPVKTKLIKVNKLLPLNHNLGCITRQLFPLIRYSIYFTAKAKGMGSRACRSRTRRALDRIETLKSGQHRNKTEI